MSAKKRGPGRPPKSKNRKPAATARHTVPKHFWSQVGAILLAVATAILVAGLFGMGGELPVQFAGAVRWLVGWTAFVIPVVFAVQIIQVFKQPEDRIPAVIWVTTVIFLALFSGTFQLTLPDPTSLELAQAGNGGGTIGWAVADMALGFVNVPIAALIFVTLMLILLMFIFSISPASVIEVVRDFIGREAAEEGRNVKVAAASVADDGKIKVGGLSKGEIEKGKPTDNEGPDDDGKKKHRRLLGRHKDDEDELAREEEDDKPKHGLKPAPAIEVNSVNKIEKAAPAIVINNSNWKLPDVKELSNAGRKAEPGNIKLRAQQIESTLAEFGIGGNVRKVNVGPRVTQYCLEPQRGIPLSRITSLQDKFALNMQVESLRIEAPIPGQPYVGIEIPNKRAASVNLRTILESEEWAKQRSPLAFAVGLNITGDPIVLDLASLPHLLVAGTTGSGKSVMMNVMVMSMLFRNTPDDLKFILVDPKGNEMSSYADMPHLAAPVISGTSAEELHKLTKTLLWVTEEMDRRYQVFRDKGGIKKLSDFRKKFPDEKMPYIVVIIDEYTDIIDSLKSTERETVTTAVQRIAQKGRAAGIHEVIMMQAPRAKYIQGPLKANIPAGFAFMVRSKLESQQIINQSGAETLMGQGDMLMLTAKLKNPRRVQSAFVDDSEVEQIVTELKMQSGPQYDDTLLARLSDDTPVGGEVAIGQGKRDSMYQSAVRLVISQGEASTSSLQTNLGLGYGRAARIMNMMEKNGVVGPKNGSKPREVLVSSIDELDDN